VQGILRLHQSGRVSGTALGYAADKALLFRKPTLSHVEACAEHYEVNGARLVLVKPKRRLRGLPAQRRRRFARHWR
jgi:hypothetical protein